MTPLEHERFLDLARKVAAGKASASERNEMEMALSENPALKPEFEQLRKDVLIAQETLPFLHAVDAPARNFPGYARERLQTKVRQTLGQKESRGLWSRLSKLLNRPQSTEASESKEATESAALLSSIFDRTARGGREGGEGSEDATSSSLFQRLGNVKKKKVLVVDDEKSVTDLVKSCLEQTGRFEVRAENLAEHALAAAKEFKPDLVLLDTIMPRLSGGDVAAQFRSDAELCLTRIVFLAAAVRRHRGEELEAVIPPRNWEFPCLAKDENGIICHFPGLAKRSSHEEQIEMMIEAIEKHARKPGTKPEV